MKLYGWTLLAFEINSSIEKKVKDFSFEDLHRWIESKTLLEELKTKYNVDTSMIDMTGNEDYFYEMLEQVAGGLKGREGGKVQIEKSGFSLLLAFIIEAIQREYWEK